MQERLQTTLNTQWKYFKRDGLVINREGETWMDSIPRAGARVEIQALNYCLLELMRLVTKDTRFLRMETRMASTFKERYFKNGYLWDGVDDNTLRPNIFIAGYAAQKLLTNEEWGVCINKALKGLWNPWGGFASIDKSHPNYHPHHTGEQPASYHNGDSWFFLNNLAGIVMHKIAPKRYAKHIKMLLEASTKEILNLGCLGCHGELSSSSQLTSQGAWLQAWSCATYLEFVEEVYKNA